MLRCPRRHKPPPRFRPLLHVLRLALSGGRATLLLLLLLPLPLFLLLLLPPLLPPCRQGAEGNEALDDGVERITHPPSNASTQAWAERDKPLG